MNEDEIKVLLINLPYTIKGFSLKTFDDHIIVILNSRLSYEQNRITYEHELLHIKNDDFYRECNVCEIESEYHV